MNFCIVILLLLYRIKCELKYIFEVFRHGARKNILKQEPQSGELTPVGQRQHFLLGTQLRKEYIDQQKFLSSTFQYNEFRIISSPFNRSFQSAQSQLYGLYPKSNDQLTEKLAKLAIPQWDQLDIDPQIYGQDPLPQNFQSIPITTSYDHSINIFNDWNLNSLIQRNTQLYQNILKEFNTTFQVYQKVSGNTWNPNIDPIQQIVFAMDDIFCNDSEGIPRPDYILQNQELALNMTFLYDDFLFLMFYQTPTFQARFSEEFFNFMNKSINQSALKEGSTKWDMVSGHDTTIALIQSVLNITNHDCLYQMHHHKQNFQQCRSPPRFTANIIMEFYKEIDRNFIKVRYNGDYVLLCQKQSQECDLNEFNQRIQYLLSQNDHIPIDGYS